MSSVPDGSGLTPRVGVVVLNWNGLRDTLECLQSVQELDYPDIRVVVVDNGSTDGSPGIIRERFPAAILLRNERNEGFAAGNNAGIRTALDAEAEYIWLLNNDTVLEKDTLTKLVESLRKTPGAGMASPVIHYHEAPETVQFCGSYIDWKRRRIVKVGELESLPGNGMDVSLWGTALLVKREVVERVGYLDERYFAYHEDEDYCMRAAGAGFRCIVVPGARVYHKNSRSTGSNDAPMQVFLRARNIYFLWGDRSRGLAKASHFFRYLGHIVSYAGRLKEKGLAESVSSCMDGAWHAFLGEGGTRRPDLRMPAPFRAILGFMASWHPYFWSCLLQGDLPKILARLRAGEGGDASRA